MSIDFSRSGVKGQGHTLNVVKAYKQDKPYLIANITLFPSLIHLSVVISNICFAIVPYSFKVMTKFASVHW